MVMVHVRQPPWNDIPNYLVMIQSRLRITFIHLDIHALGIQMSFNKQASPRYPSPRCNCTVLTPLPFGVIKIHLHSFAALGQTRLMEVHWYFLDQGNMHRIAHPKLLGDTFLSAQFKLRLIMFQRILPTPQREIRMASGGNMEVTT